MTPQTDTPGTAPALVATSTTAVGTVSKRTIAALASHFADPRETVLDSPVVVTGVASPALGGEGGLSQGLALAMAALVCAAGARTDVLLYTGDCAGCALLAAAAARLGWREPRTAPCGETGHGLAPGLTEAHRSVALFHGTSTDLGTTESAAAMARAGVRLTCWCSACDPVPLDRPCRKHSTDTMEAAWQARAWGARRPAA